MESFWKTHAVQLEKNGELMSSEEVDAFLIERGENEYMKSKWALFFVSNALMVSARCRQMVLTPTTNKVKEFMSLRKDNTLHQMYRGLIPFTLANSLHILLASAFQLSLLEIETTLDWYFTTGLCFGIAQLISHPLSVLATRV